jgi:hypothetical protein
LRQHSDDEVTDKNLVAWGDWCWLANLAAVDISPIRAAQILDEKLSPVNKQPTVVLRDVAFGQNDVIASNSTDGYVLFVETEFVGASTFLGQRQVHHDRTLCKNHRLVHLLVEELSRRLANRGECLDAAFPAFLSVVEYPASWSMVGPSGKNDEKEP